MIEKYQIIGINHKCSNKQFRESIFSSAESIEAVLKFLFSFKEIEYCIILSTSNRVEFHFLTVCNNIADFVEAVFSKFQINHYEIFSSSAYIYSGKEALRHLFNVISSIDSEKLGDSQIISQVRHAFHLSEEFKNHNFAHRLLNAAIRASSTVRANTAIGQPIKSIAGIACTYIMDYCKKDDKILLIGYDNVIKTIAMKLSEKGFIKILIFHNSDEELPEPVKPFLTNSAKNHFYDAVGLVLNQDFEINNVKKSIRVIIDLQNALTEKYDSIKHITQTTIYQDIESMKLNRINSIEMAKIIINKEVLRFEMQCNEDSFSS